MVPFARRLIAPQGQIRVTTATSGRDAPNWYRATLTASGGSNSETTVPANAAVTIDNLNPDVYEVALSGLSPNCRMTGPAVQTATVTAGGLALKQKPIQRRDFDDFVECYKPAWLHKRRPTWSADNPEGRWRCYDYEELLKRDKLSLDLFWIKDKSLTDAASLPPPDVIAEEIADDLEAALEQFTKIAARLARPPSATP